MSKTEGLKNKYRVDRLDGKPLKGQCIVLEFGDPMNHAALNTWADTMEAAGYLEAAQELRFSLKAYKP